MFMMSGDRLIMPLEGVGEEEVERLVGVEGEAERER